MVLFHQQFRNSAENAPSLHCAFISSCFKVEKKRPIFLFRSNPPREDFLLSVHKKHFSQMNYFPNRLEAGVQWCWLAASGLQPFPCHMISISELLPWILSVLFWSAELRHGIITPKLHFSPGLYQTHPVQELPYRSQSSSSLWRWSWKGLL